MFSIDFDFECTYIEEVQFFSRIQTGYGKILIQRDTRIQSKCRKKAYNFVKKRLQHSCFPVNIIKFLRTAFSIEHQWLFLIPEVNLEASQTSLREFFCKKWLTLISQ